MNNNMNFDPMTGLPLNKNLIDDEQQLQKEQQIIHEDINYIPANDSNHEEEIKNQLQSIPTVEQKKEDFINNTQTINQEKKDEKKKGINFAFIIILFLIILATIYFLFPLLLKYI